MFNEYASFVDKNYGKEQQKSSDKKPLIHIHLMWLYEVWTLNGGQHSHNLLSERYLLPN
jgi:hypothetical protein